MKVLSIGGSGFISSYVVRRLLEQGHTVTVFHRGRSTVPAGAHEIIGDRKRLIESADALREVDANVVIDMALSSARQARGLLAVLAGAVPRLVATSSGDVYRACTVLHGLDAGPLEPMPLTETSALRTNPQTYPAEAFLRLQQVFGWLDEEYDKVAVERELLASTDVQATVLRLPLVYGPGDSLHRLYPLIKRMDDNRPAILLEEKHARWRAPRGYVENVAAAIVLAATDDRAAGRVYNVAEPDALSEREWTRAVADVIGWRGQIVSVPAMAMPQHLRLAGNFDQHWIIDSTRIRDELGYVEHVPRAEAIRRTVEWERANPPRVDPQIFDYAAEDAAIASRMI
jgi:nucleoside-diphosphate-sugar epimerase